MANIQLTITRSSPAGAVNRNKDFSDADLDRLQAAASAELRDQGIANPTNGQIAQYLFDRVVADFKSFTRNQETRAAEAGRTTIGL